jgi:hypothetical protein
VSVDSDWARGIDVSYANSTTPNLAGRDFVFVRACYGTTIDRRWGFHSTNVKRAGSVLGAYAFGIYGSGAAQAEAFLEIAEGAELFALDLEKESGRPRMTAAQARDFINTVRDTGRDIGLYHSDSAFPNLGQDWNWVAKWGSTPPAREWTFWQYRGYPLDLNYFHGTTTALYAFAGGGGLPEMIKARGSLVMKDGMAAFLKRIRITRDTPILDTPGGERIATAKNGYVYPYVGAAAGATRAVLINTSIPYSDDQPGPTVLYVAAAATAVEDAPVPPSGGDVTHSVGITVDGQVVETFTV